MIFKTLYNLLPLNQRKKALVVLFIRILHSLLDFIGIALLLVILLFVVNRQLTDIPIYFIILGGGLILLIKNLVAVLAGRQQIDWLLSLYRYYSLRLLETDFSSGLLAIRSKGAITITHEVNSICYTYAMNVVGSAILLIGHMLLLSLFILGFIIYSPSVALIFIGCLLPATGLYCYFIRRKVTVYGKEEMKAKRNQSVLVESIFRGYIEVKTHSAFPYFRECFKKEMEQISRYRKATDTYMRLSSVYMEMGMIFILLLLALTVGTGHHLILILSIYSIAGMRLVPIVRMIINCWVQIQNNLYVIEILDSTINKEASIPPVESKSEMVLFEQSIKISNIHFSYNDSNRVLNGFSMYLKCGEKVGIQGDSGIGKTTLFNLLLGCISPQQGEILIDNVSLTNMNLQEWHRQVGYVSQDIFIMDASIAENIALGVHRKDIDFERISHVLKQVRLDDWVILLPDGIHTNLGENGYRISGGQKQRIGIARALYKGSHFLLLDEVTSNLDHTTEKEILATLVSLCNYQQPMSLLIISHREQTLSICDRIIYMH